MKSRPTSPPAELPREEGVREIAESLPGIEEYSCRRLRAVVLKLGRREPWARVARAFLRAGRLILGENPKGAGRLARAALLAAGRVDDDSKREGLSSEGETLLGDALRRLGRLAAARRSFGRAALHLEKGSEASERAFFLTALAALREEEGRHEEALALLTRGAALYGAMGEVDRQAAALSSKAALEMRRLEREEALQTIEEMLLLMDEGLDGRFALGAAVSFAALIATPASLSEAIAILEKVRRRYSDLGESEEMASLNLLEGRLLTFAPRPELAEVCLKAAFRGFLGEGLLHDAALAALALAVFYLRVKREGVLLASIEETLGAILSEKISEGMRHTLSAFREAVREGKATIALANACMSYIDQSAKP